MRLLIIEGDEVLRDGLVVGLHLAGFTSEAVATVAEAEVALEMGGFSGMVLDLMLPDGSGLDLLSRLRARGSTLPVLMLTARQAWNRFLAQPDVVRFVTSRSWAKVNA